MEQKRETYRLMTAIAMIVGIVIGSGIYFKADDILKYTGGNDFLGFLVLLIGAACIIFGSLSLSELSKRTAVSGGLTGYFETFLSPSLAAGFGWFQTFIYFPSITAIISWVAAIYTSILFAWDLTFELQIFLGLGYIILFSAINILSRVLGGYFQNFATVIKLIPLIIIAIAGLVWNQALPVLPNGIDEFVVTASGWSWLTALVPLAYSYDGWTVAINIAPEVINPKKNMTKALIIGPFIILLTYLLFFDGMNRILGASFIMSVGDSAIYYAISRVLGERFSSAVMVVIVISVLGVLNGVLLGGMRMPQALAEKGIIQSKKLALINPRLQVSVFSCILFTCLSVGWLVIHYFVHKYQLLAGSDVSEISVVFNYLCYAVLYAAVIRLHRNGEIKSKITGLATPSLAILGSILILIGSLFSSPLYVSLFIFICFVVNYVGSKMYRLRNNHSK